MNSSLSQFTGTMRVALAGAILLWCAPPEFAFASGGAGQQQTQTQNEKDKEAAAKEAREKKSPPQAKPRTQSGTNTKPGGQETPNGTGAAPAQPNTAQPRTKQTPTPGTYVPPGTQTGGQPPVNPRATPSTPNAVTPNPRQSPVYPSPTYQPQQPVYQPGASYPATQGARTAPIEDTGVCPADPPGPQIGGFGNEMGNNERAPGAMPGYGQGSNAARGGAGGETPRTISLPPVQEKFPQNDLKFAPRPPIRFEAFPMVDLETGKPVAPTATIRLPDGKRTTAGEYYKELNTYEQWINQQGQTLRQPQKNAIVTVASLDVNQALLRRQVEQAPKAIVFSRQAMLDKITGIIRPVTFQIRPEDLAQLQKRSQLSPAELAAQVQKVNRSCLRSPTINGGLTNPATFGPIWQLLHRQIRPQLLLPCQPVNDQKPIGPWDVGDPAHFNAYVKGNLSLTGQVCEPPDLSHFNVNNHTQLSLSVDAEAGGYVFNSGGDIVKLTGSASGNGIANTVSASFNVFVLGSSVYSMGYGPSASYTYTHTFPIVDVDKSANMIVMAGPVPIDLTIGFKGTADVELYLSLYPTSVAVVATPNVDTSVYGQAGVDLLVAETGVGAELVLEKASFTVLDTTGVGYRVSQGGYYLHSELTTIANLNVLSGDVYFYLKYYYFCWSSGVCSTQDNYSLWNWPGMNFNGWQYDDEVNLPLGW